MKSFGLLLCVVVLCSPLALPAQERVNHEVIDRIKTEGLERSHVMATFNMLTNVIGPRLTATPAYKEAADWTAQQLEAWGMSNVHLEAWPFGRGWTLEGLTLEMIEPRYFPLIGYPEAWTPSTRGELVGEPVYVGDKTVDQAAQLSLRDAIVLGQPPQPAFIKEDREQPLDADAPVRIGAPRFIRNPGAADGRELADLLWQRGAGVVLRPNQGEHGTIFVLGRRNTPDDAVPVVVLASEHYNMIVRLQEAGARVRLRIRVQSQYHEGDTSGYNVIAEIPGTDPQLKDQVVMVGAHLDSWHSATGATDNADASASVMEAMRILKVIGVEPRRTIRMALWGGEEQGLHGSRRYVERHLTGEANQAARDNFSVYFNHDPGLGAIYGFYLEGNQAVKPVFDAWLEPLKDIGARANLMDKIGSTDHLSFIRAGLPGFNTLQDYRDYDVRTHHTNTDFYERLSEDDLQESAIVLATFLYHAAMRDEMIPRGDLTP